MRAVEEEFFVVEFLGVCRTLLKGMHKLETVRDLLQERRAHPRGKLLAYQTACDLKVSQLLPDLPTPRL